MPKKQPPVYLVELGRVMTRDGKPHFMLATPSDFFSRLVVDYDGKPALMGVSQADADKLAQRIAFLLTEYGEDE